MFELDSNFNETIKSRHRDDFSYASFSEGEKMRINLAILFTWRAVAKLRNSASCNLLIMDEVLDGSLDGNGTDEFLKILNNLTLDTNTYIISHKVDQMHDKFANVIKFEKHKNFSRVL
jgi:energy-coupling factor transporter ATP-binding protein EcfA2